MASMNKENKGKGAAEEPEPEPDDASPSTAAASYDPADYQKPHPDDRGGGGGGGGKKGGATKPRGKAKAAPTAKGGKAKGGKAKDGGSHRCANCDKPGAKSRCSRCGVEWYCDRNCQRVSLVVGRVGLRAAPPTRTHVATGSTWRQSALKQSAIASLLHPPPPVNPSHPRRSTTSTAATRARAGPTCSPPPSTRSRSGCARRRWRRTGA